MRLTYDQAIKEYGMENIYPIENTSGILFRIRDVAEKKMKLYQLKDQSLYFISESKLEDMAD